MFSRFFCLVNSVRQILLLGKYCSVDQILLLGKLCSVKRFINLYEMKQKYWSAVNQLHESCKACSNAVQCYLSYNHLYVLQIICLNTPFFLLTICPTESGLHHLSLSIACTGVTIMGGCLIRNWPSGCQPLGMSHYHTGVKDCVIAWMDSRLQTAC